MRIKNYFVFLSLLGLQFSVYSQVVIEKEEVDKNVYSLYCKFDDQNITISKTQGKDILSYQGFIEPSKPGEMALPAFDVFISVPRDEIPEIVLITEDIENYYALPSLNPSITILDSQVVYTNQDHIKKYGYTKPLLNKGYLWIGENYCLHLNLNLFQLNADDNGISLIKKFIIQLKYDSEIQLPTTTFGKRNNTVLLNNAFGQNYVFNKYSSFSTSGSWINYNSEYLKIGTNKDGIYRIDVNDFTSAGINSNNIDPKTFKLFLKGDEIPIYISGDYDGKFDGIDFIEFAGLRNMGGNYREISKVGESYKEYINRYSDTTVYFLTWNGIEGLRTSSPQKISNSIADTLKYYYETIHIEKNNWFDFSMQDLVSREMPYWAENKTWNEGNLGVGTRNITFTPNDIFPNKPLKVLTKLQDYASSIDLNAHLLAISLNSGVKQDSGYVNKYQQKVLIGNYNSNLLKTGNNTLNVYSFTTAANPNLCIVDWYEMEYPRYLKAINDTLNFQFPFLTDVSLKAINITNLNNLKNYSLWKVGKNYKRYRFRGSGTNGIIVDTVENSDRFFLIDSTKTLKPFIYYKKVFVNLKDPNNSADYVAITHKKFLKNVLTYASFISQHYNVKTKVIDIDDIYDEFAYGFFQPESIRDFLITIHSNWKIPSPHYVALIGGATYDYLGNKTKYQGAPRVFNYVPSFGVPVSDSWFVIWDTTGAHIPQMSIGRLPVTTNEELLWYMQKHQQYVMQINSAWNKRYLFFSGGTGNIQSQIDQLRNTNNFIINNYIIHPPIGGNYTHFYKTTNPTTNFGAYSPHQFQSVVDSGSVFISYLGHSGTQTWDNSITDPGQLKNKIDRYPLITDFGCSTAKFAEPDVVSFSQLFVNSIDGQAIGYIANSSLGFTSTSYSFPQIFYKKILADSIYTIGDAHRLAKLDLLNKYGSSGAYKLFALTNTLIGDPIVKLSIPTKTNLSVSNENIHFLSNPITDADDSISVLLKYYNFGSVKADTFIVSINSYYNKTLEYSRNIYKQVPLFTDSIRFSIPVKNLAGQHTLLINLDSNNRLDEISKDDNKIEMSYLVSSSSLKLQQPYRLEAKLANPLSFINPVGNPFSPSFQLEFSLRNDFQDVSKIFMNFDTLRTKINIPDNFLNKRVFLRSRKNNFSDYSDVISFINGTSNSYYLSDSLGLSVVEKKNIKQVNQKLTLDDRNIEIKSLSAGFNDGNTALILLNNQNLIPENTLGGHHIVLLEDSTYKFVKYNRFYILGNTAAVQDYTNFLDTLSQKYIVIFAVSDEGSVSSAVLKSRIKQFGSKYIDSLGFRGSWAMIGKKGAKTGSVPESYSKVFRGRVRVDTSISTRYDQGSFLTTKIGPASIWKNILIVDSLSAGSAINYKILGINKDESVDTLHHLQIKNSYGNLTSVDAKKYSYIKIQGELSATSKSTSPSWRELEVSYSSVPELGTNYQVVSVSSDTLTQGESENLSFFVYNVGESRADSFKVKVELVKPDNSREKIFEEIVDSLGSEKRKEFRLSYNTASITGNRNFYISIDPENKITELYKDNNIYSIPFYVKPNEAPASLKLTFDGNDIIDGDFISPKPNIKIELNDQSLIPIQDTTAVQLYLNSKKIYFINNPSIAYSYSAENPKFVIEYKPTLENGSYTLKVIGKNATGQIIDSTGLVRNFMVKNEMQLLNVYNYPNPFNVDTYFTFKLTQIPDELKIKIYTLTGRSIKEFNLTSTELKYDFNKIYWDGRDTDGDLIANGVYLYKVILRKGSESSQTTQKLAVVR